MTNELVNQDGSISLWPEGAPEPDGVKAKRQPIMIPRLAKSAKPRGAVIVCPGGGYAMLADHEGIPIAEMLNSAGIHAFVLKYRVKPHRHPAPLLDAQRAIRFVRFHAKELNVDPSRIGILGFSAGGHLTSTAATHFDNGDAASPDPIERVSSRPDAAVLCYAVVSLRAFGHTGSQRNLLGPNASEEMISLLSNESHVTSETPPTFLWHTADDEAVPVQNSLAFADALARNKVPFALHIFPHGKHGLGLAPESPDVAAWAGLCQTWLAGQGF